MKNGRWLEICLLAALGAGSAAGFDGASFRGVLWDGAPDYSDAAFAPLEEVAAKVATGDQNDPEMWNAFEKALMGIMCPNGPMAGMRVTLRSVGETPVSRETTTDEKGQFRFDGLEDVEYALTIQRPGKGCHGPQEYAWRLKLDDEHRQTGAELVWPETLLVARGQVVDSAGQPLAGVRIAAYENRYNGELSRWGSVLHVVETATDKRGRFKLEGLRPMRFFPGGGGPAGYVLKVENEGFASQVRKIDAITQETRDAMRRWWNIAEKTVPAGRKKSEIKWPVPANKRGVIEGVEFTLMRSATLGGRVLDADGAPLSDAQVWLRYLDAPPYQPLPFPFGPGRARTGADGRFSIPGLATGRYFVAVTVAGRSREYRDAPVELREGETRDDLELLYAVPPTGRIEASVFEKEGAKPIGVYTAYVERVVGAPDSGVTYGQIARNTNRPGFFTVENVSPGEAQFHVSAPGYVSRRAACEVESGRTAILPIEMQAAGSVLVRVTCNGVATRPYQLVSFPEGATNAVWGWSRTTNAEGRCEIHELPPGLNRLRAQVFGNDQSRFSLVPVQIEVGQTNEVELETEGPCSFDLDLVIPTNAVARAWVEPADAPETEAFDAKVDMKVYLWAYESGRVAVTNLPAGEYRVGVQKLESTKGIEHVPMKADQTQTIRLEEGQRPAVAVGF